MSNPFHNPWNKNNEQRGYSGPVYGNAYEDDSNQPQQQLNMPSPNTTNTGFSNSGYYNAWGQEEEIPQKTQYETHHHYPPPSSPLQQQSSPYQYTGTPHGNHDTSHLSPYSKSTPSPQPAHLTSPTPTNASTVKQNNSSRFARNRVHEEGAIKTSGRPNKWRVLLRFIMFLCSVGHLGFAAGARPVSLLYIYMYLV